LLRCPSEMSRERRATWWVALWLGMLSLSQPLYAQADGEQVIIRSALIDVPQSVLLLTTRLEFELPEGARQAVREGAELTLSLEFELRRSRRFWLDEAVATLEQKYALSYHALSERYIVRNLNSDDRSTYAALDSALEALKSIDSLPMLDRSLLEPDERYEARLKTTLDVHNLPDALRWVLFWTADWRQDSDWFSWPLKL
jgi:hypothetical protein